MEAPLCLDLTRLLSRAGRPALTGIDRVELAYLNWALARRDSSYLVATSRGHLLLDEGGALALRDAVTGQRDLPRADLLSRLTGKGTDTRHRAEALMRQNAVASIPRGLTKLLGHRIPGGSIYLNVGHSNLREPVLSAISEQRQVWVLLHDAIPLDVPELNRPEMVSRFRRMLEATANHASGLIVNSAHTGRRVEAHWPEGRAMPNVVVAPLGLDPISSLPAQEPAKRPYFVAIGTLEARKNHALLLDIWERLAKETPHHQMPHLHLIGVRGWRNEAFFSRLDASPLLDVVIHEHGGLPDTDRNALLCGAKALLFPSIEEGFGLPPAEAAAAGVLPICSDLPVLREILGDAGVYLPPDDPYPWLETIRQCLDGRLGPERTASFAPPTWTDHFRRVEEALSKT